MYALLGNELSASQIFPALTLFSNLSWIIIQVDTTLSPMEQAHLIDVHLQFPDMLTRWMEAKTSLERLNKFFRLPELAPDSITSIPADQMNRCAIRVVDGLFEWEPMPLIDDEDDAKPSKSDQSKSKKGKTPADESGASDEMEGLLALDDIPSSDDEDHEDGKKNQDTFKLHDINLAIQRGELIAIIGRVGIGKTSLINCLLGEMKLISGRVEHQDPMHVSYTCQRSDRLFPFYSHPLYLNFPFSTQSMDQECYRAGEHRLRPTV